MKRAFYNARDALHQMLEHGFTFAEWSEEDIRRAIGAGDENLMLETDSPKLLEPRKGDLILSKSTNQAAGARYRLIYSIGPYYCWTTSQVKIPLSHVKRIVERDGKAFHAPTWEDAT